MSKVTIKLNRKGVRQLLQSRHPRCGQGERRKPRRPQGERRHQLYSEGAEVI